MGVRKQIHPADVSPELLKFKRFNEKETFGGGWGLPVLKRRVGEVTVGPPQSVLIIDRLSPIDDPSALL